MARTLVGTVVSTKTDKTITVRVEERKTHPLYHKQYLDSKKFLSHDEKSQAEVGDKVSIVETRPISKHKHFSLEKVLEKPVIREVAKGEAEL
jgi:small subunit ribosomal protein S17